MTVSSTTPCSPGASHTLAQVSKAHQIRIRALQEQAFALEEGRENPLIKAISATVAANGKGIFEEGVGGYEAVERKLEVYIQVRRGKIPPPVVM